MKIKQEIDNGNVASIRKTQVFCNGNSENQRITSNKTSLEVYDNTNKTENYHSEHDCRNSIYPSRDFENTKTDEHSYFQSSLVCNKQYAINRHNNFDSNQVFSQLENLKEDIKTIYPTGYNYLGFGDVSTTTPSIEEEQGFENSDTDEMSEEGIQAVPRGIVNPNYPGFQHLAHTLQDYSSRIDNFYHSDNDMTDDDVEITDLTDIDTILAPSPSFELHNNNNNNGKLTSINDGSLKSDHYLFSDNLDRYTINEIPDLLKTVSNNNNYDVRLSPESTYLDTDIENHFHTSDIIGDFNKEIADEIKVLLNYNINIQDDLEELRKDIKDTFSKPIETTINNISDVVNHVIKKLVEIKSDEGSEYTETEIFKKQEKQIVPIKSAVNLNGNERNSKTNMDVIRPTYLLLESSISSGITDAFLSDGKEELEFYDTEYDTETLSNNVENTIKQLSTELRKIIPKLDEMREHDKLWASCKSDHSINMTDSNSNDISDVAKHQNLTPEINGATQMNDKNIQLASPKEKNTEHFIKNKTDSKATDGQLKVSAQELPKAQKPSSSVRRTESEDYNLDSFDVYNIETALPTLDFDAIENHLRAAKEEERRKHNDREEIRRRLATGVEAEGEYYSMGHTERPGKKPSLHSRLQNGKNLQICFMNEAASDNESQGSDLEKTLSSSSKSLSRSSIFSKSNYSLNNHPYQTRPLSISISKNDKISTVQSGAKLRPPILSSKTPKSRSAQSLGQIEVKESDFHALQTTLQTEARIALAQAKELARIQMERERAGRAESPVSEMLRRGLEKARVAPGRRRLSRQRLTGVNVAQLQVIVNELHCQIESLNEGLVKLLMARDELHMSQDSMLVDIEDLTRYFGVKEQTKKTKGSGKSGMRRLASLVNK